MRHLFACAAVILVLLVTGCADEPAAAPTPQPAANQDVVPDGGILAPADAADEVVTDLNQRTYDVQQQPNLDQRTGSGYGAE